MMLSLKTRRVENRHLDENCVSQAETGSSNGLYEEKEICYCLHSSRYELFALTTSSPFALAAGAASTMFS